MASLLPLLHDLLPMIMPSEPHVVRGDEPACVEERAEAPPWYQHGSGAERAPGASSAPRTGLVDDSQESISSSESDVGQLEPIQLLDIEERHAAAPIPAPAQHGLSSGPSKPTQQTGGPKVFRQDAMVGVTDKMCATGKPKSIFCFSLGVFSALLYFNMRAHLIQIPQPGPPLPQTFLAPYCTRRDF